MAKLKFRKGFNKDLISRNLSEARQTDGDGRISFVSGEFDDWKAILISSISGVELDDRAFRSAVSKALFSKTLSTPFTAETIIAEIGKQYRRKTNNQKDYFCIFDLIGISNINPKWVSSNGLRMYFNPVGKSKPLIVARKEREILQEKNQKSHWANLSAPFSNFVVLRCKADDAYEAYEKSINAVDEFRALVNLKKNFKLISRASFGMSSKQVNQFVIGPLQTVHLADGRFEDGLYWIEKEKRTNYSVRAIDLTELDPRQSVFKIFKKLHEVNGLGKEAPYALQTYTRALDLADWVDSFLRLWALLEFLTNIKNADYEKLISRAAKMHKDYDAIREMARHLRVRRNELVHSSKEIGDAELLIYQLKRLVEPLLNFYVTNPFSFKDRDELSRFLDLPHNSDDLDRSKTLIEFALKIRS